MVLICYRHRTYINMLMSCTTTLHSNPKEYDSHNERRNCMCDNRIRGQSPSVAGVTNTLDRQFNWRSMRTTHCPRSGSSGDDVIPVHSPWPRMYLLVCPPPPNNMLKFSGYSSTMSCRWSAHKLVLCIPQMIILYTSIAMLMIKHKLGVHVAPHSFTHALYTLRYIYTRIRHAAPAGVNTLSWQSPRHTNWVVTGCSLNNHWAPTRTVNHGQRWHSMH